MLSSETHTNLSSDFVSTTAINSITGTTDLTIAPSLPPPLTAPAGWRSQIIDSNTPLDIANGINLINTNNSYQGYDTLNTSVIGQSSSGYLSNNNNNNNNYKGYNTYNTSDIGQSSTGYLSNNTEYLNASINKNTSYHQQQPIYTAQQQKNIVNLVENQYPPPLVVRKKLPNNLVTYKQNVSVRYLKPPTPPPSGPLIIREVRPPPPRPPSPIQIRQRPPPPPTPPPIVLREQPPPPPPRAPTKVVEKLLPPPPQPPRRIVVERFGACPPKPADVIIERWLPYKQPEKRRVLIERASEVHTALQEPNLLIIHDSPSARINKQYINQGVIRADPDSYLRQYGAELSSRYSSSHHGYLVDEATRAIPPPIVSSSDHHYENSYSDGYSRASSPYISNTWERTRVVSPIHRSSSYHYGYSEYDSPHYYYNRSPSRYGYDSYRYYDDYPTHRGRYLTMTDVTPSWNGYCRSSSYDPCYRSSYYDHDYRSSSYCDYDYDYRSSSYYDPYCHSSSYYSPTVRVRSEGELRDVLCELTNGRVPSALYSY